MLALLGVDPQSLPVAVQIEAGDTKRGLDPVDVEEVPNPQDHHVRTERMQTGRRRLNPRDRQRLASRDPDSLQFVDAEIGVLAEPVPGDADLISAKVGTDR